LPLDVIWLDIEYAEEKRYFKFISDFHDIDRFLTKMEQLKKHVTIITDPHIKVDLEFFVYNEG
jgi:alpha-glucosidase (family GH31 glycosyl hydrolase)